MKQEKKILDEKAPRDGMTVPAGYFAEFACRMALSLEKTEYEEQAHAPIAIKPRSFWERVRPYAYMAAMFAGVWCMLKMFTLMSSNTGQVTLSPTLSKALANETFVNEYVMPEIDQYDIMSQMMDEGFDLDLLSKDFDEAFEGEDSEYTKVSLEIE
ncbi:MAG: hypothetical protein NC102_01895 [Clostridium sp.]|nr:hypothetical protein [Clostridium sp.]